MVPRGRIELPTRGFSDQDYNHQNLLYCNGLLTLNGLLFYLTQCIEISDFIGTHDTNLIDLIDQNSI